MAYDASKDFMAASPAFHSFPVDCVAVTPHDTDHLGKYAAGLRIFNDTAGVATVRVVPLRAPADTDHVDLSVPVGLTIEALPCRMVKSTGTTAGLEIHALLPVSR